MAGRARQSGSRGWAPRHCITWAAPSSLLSVSCVPLPSFLHCHLPPQAFYLYKLIPSSWPKLFSANAAPSSLDHRYLWTSFQILPFYPIFNLPTRGYLQTVTPWGEWRVTPTTAQLELQEDKREGGFSDLTLSTQYLIWGWLVTTLRSKNNALLGLSSDCGPDIVSSTLHVLAHSATQQRVRWDLSLSFCSTVGKQKHGECRSFA